MDSLGDRMKEYENVERRYLTRRTTTLIRLDGKAFHSLTKGFDRPFDKVFMRCMWDTAIFLCMNVMGCKIAYVQSDEIQLLLTDYENIGTEAWFSKNIQKMVSVSASMATAAFNNALSIDAYDGNIYEKRMGRALFDSRVYNIPKEEVCNAFIWRQQDATRNAIQMLGQAHFSHKQLHKKSCNQIQEMLFQEKGINFNDLPTPQKRGVCVVKEMYEKDGAQRSRWVTDLDIPIFTQDRQYIEKYL